MDTLNRWNDLKPFEQSGSESVLSVVVPCLNEVETLKDCVDEILKSIGKRIVSREILIADNGSIDGSQAVAQLLGASVVDILSRGYGNAIRGGVNGCAGEFIIMGDADGSYDFGDIPKFVAELEKGADLVMGNRFAGGIMPGAMPWLHRYLGNPVLSWIGRLFFGCKVHDFHCGLRG